MNAKKVGRQWFLAVCWVLLFTGANAQNWNPAHSIGTTAGVAHFPFGQISVQMEELQPAVFPNTGISYEWESGTKPLELLPIAGTNTQGYTYSGPLQQTLYFRRKTIFTANNTFIYSNTIKLQVVSAGWEDRNYVREHAVRISGQATWQAIDALAIGDKIQTTTYMDGLGRSVQQISKGAATPAQTGGTWGDVVQFSAFDPMGLEPLKYLPYTTTTEAGKFKTAPQTAQAQYYTATYNESPAYSQITFENSPLNRVKNIKAPGQQWAASAGNTTGYETNTIEDNVQVFSTGYVQGAAPVHMGVYPAGTLYKAVSTDENLKKVIEFTDKSGQLILRKVELEDTHPTAHGGWICTYSVYDDFGQLRFQLQPEAVKYLEASGWSFATTNGDKVLKELCFQYFYDEKGRNTWKKAPGAEPLLMVYDNRDRLVFTQDGNQRIKTTPEWTATLYDELDRPVITTLYNTGKTAADLQTDIAIAATQSSVTTTQAGEALVDLVVPSRDATITQYKARNSIEFVAGFESESGAQFTAEIDPTATGSTTTINVLAYKNPIGAADLNNTAVCTILKYQFYDDYSFSGKKSFQPDFENAGAYSFSQTDIQPIVSTKRTLGFPTGSKVRILGTPTFLNATSYFDDRGAPIQMLEDNQLSGTDATTLQYHFDGRVMSSFKRHSTINTGYSGFGVLTKNVFDKLGRVTGIDKKWGSNPFQTVAEYSYDDMGRLKTKRLAPGYTAEGKTELESLTYSYNLHNLLTGINKDYALKAGGTYNKWDHFFGLYLGYDNKDAVFNAARLNGQVAGLLWNTQGDDQQRKYDYTYDNAGRLVNASFNERKTTTDLWSNAKMDFSVTGSGGKIGYDLNGNLLSMIQKGVVIGGAAPVSVDDLQYSYAALSNKLLKVTDVGQLGASNGQFGDFKDGSNGTADDYVYDANGNLVVDLNKGAKDLGNVAGANGIRYNFLDKPEEIRIAGKGVITLQYDAEGSKLRKTFAPEGGGTTVITSYVSGYVYQERLTNGQSSGVKLQYISFEEGRIRPMQAVSQNNGYDFVSMDGNLDLPDGKRGAIDFYIRDYQENVRMILTEETHIGSNQATMETSRASQEEPLFGRSGSGNEVATTRFAVADIPGQTSGGGWQNGNIASQVSRLGALAASKVGPNALLKVMGGDRISSQ
ncbi:hypothetical protein HRH25_16225, partial [Flavisolibacter sp. BT320]|nr:hypothetical protein [Flavisolibacter longurius]